MKPKPTDPGERLADLYRQGFMKSAPKQREKKLVPTVACEACLNWHPQGKHTATADLRRENLAKARAIAKANADRLDAAGLVRLSDGSVARVVEDLGEDFAVTEG